MSLSSNISSLATRIATEFKTIKTLVAGNSQGSLDGLNTTAKGNIVAAINEVKNTADAAAGGGISIDDDNVRLDATYSSSKIEGLADDLQTSIDAKPNINNASTSSTTDTWSASKITAELANVSVDLTELIDDDAASTTTVYSSSATDSKIASAKNELLGGASAAFDTLKELEDAIGDSESAIGGLTTQIGEKVSYAQAQTLTAPQQATARTNIGAASQGDLTTLSTTVGTDTDYVPIFEAGLA